MTIREFKDLKNSEKIHMIRRDGSFVAERRLGIDRIYLFAIGNIFIELLHQLSDPNCRGVIIHDIFEGNSRMQFYLERTTSTNIFIAFKINNLPN